MKPRNNTPGGMPLAAVLALRCVQILAAVLFGAGMLAAAIALRLLTRN